MRHNSLLAVATVFGNRQLRAHSTTVNRAISWAVVLLLLALAGMSMSIGIRAILDQRLEWIYRTFPRTGPKVHMCELGWDAIRLGVGLCALGAALTFWGCGLLVALIGLKARMQSRLLWMSYAWASMSFLAIWAICFAPPWRTTSIPLYITASAWAGLFLAVGTRRIPRQAVGVLFIAAIAAVFATRTVFGPGSIWFCAGTLLSLSLLAHLPVAAPRSWSRLDSALNADGAAN